jgi:hypothetical protein
MFADVEVIEPQLICQNGLIDNMSNDSSRALWATSIIQSHVAEGV